MCRSDEHIHKHHIIPKYMGGLDTSENLVEVTVTQHAMFHFCNYQLWGNEEDRIAWRGLSGLITMDEIKLEAQILGGKKGGNKNKENGTGIFKMTPEEKSAASKKGGNKNKENGTGVCGLTLEQRRENGKKVKELGLGVCGQTFEERSEAGKKGGQTNKENGTGVCGLTLEQRRENGKKVKELGLGIFKMTAEQKIEACKKGGQSNKENGTGVFKLSSEQLSENGKKGGKKGAKNTNSQKYQCTETGYISTSGPLSRYQKARGIDTSNRIRVN
jgi:general stress protein YciG